VGWGLIQQLSNQIQHYHECSGGGVLLSFGRFQHDITKQNELTTFLNSNRMRHCGPCFLAIVAKVVAQSVYQPFFLLVKFCHLVELKVKKFDNEVFLGFQSLVVHK
jgi:hypothetical protein